MGMVPFPSHLRDDPRQVRSDISSQGLRIAQQGHSQNEAPQLVKSGEKVPRRALRVGYRSNAKGLCRTPVGLLGGGNPLLQRKGVQTIRAAVQNNGPIYLSHRKREK